MTSVTATATRWEHGWELAIDGEPATQVRTLDKAVQQVIDYLDTEDETIDHSTWEITIIPSVDGMKEVTEAREATRAAAQAQEDAAKLSRAAVRQLRAQGISVTDAAAIMGVSRGRISQLAEA